MSKFTFSVDPETFAVTAHMEGQEAPFIYQPDQPDTSPWESAEQATAWIEAVIADLEASHVAPEGVEPISVEDALAALAEPVAEPAPVEETPAE